MPEAGKNVQRRENEIMRKKQKNPMPLLRVLKKDFEKNWMMYLLVLPVLAYYIIFCYVPMSGLLIAFQNYKQTLGNTFFENIMSSKWIGFKHFTDFFTGTYFTQILWNTVKISFTNI